MSEQEAKLIEELLEFLSGTPRDPVIGWAKQEAVRNLNKAMHLARLIRNERKRAAK